jgi:hypothetical protein
MEAGACVAARLRAVFCERLAVTHQRTCSELTSVKALSRHKQRVGLKSNRQGQFNWLRHVVIPARQYRERLKRPKDDGCVIGTLDPSVPSCGAKLKYRRRKSLVPNGGLCPR